VNLGPDHDHGLLLYSDPVLEQYLVLNLIAMFAKKAALKKGKHRVKENAESTSNAEPDPGVNQNSPVPIHFKNSGEGSTLDMTIHPQAMTKRGGLGRIIRSFRVGGAGNAFGLGKSQTPAITATAIPTGGVDTSQAFINQPSKHNAVDSSSSPDNLASKKYPQVFDTVLEKGGGLTVGDMALRVAVSPEQKEQEENETLTQWLAASREVLTAIKDVPGGVTAAVGAGAVIGPLIGILKLIEVGGFHSCLALLLNSASSSQTSQSTRNGTKPVTP
jgi:hypothetical protein